MNLKFYLNKFLKVDNIENYTLKFIYELRLAYDDFLESTKGSDPDFPMVDFGDKGKSVKGVNKAKVEDENIDETASSKQQTIYNLNK